MKHAENFRDALASRDMRVLLAKRLLPIFIKRSFFEALLSIERRDWYRHLALAA
jgi:hypothetical protein